MKKGNVGIAMLKLFACFAVIEMHFGESFGGYRLAVPSFMFLAIYLSAAKLQSNNWSDLQKRIGRLYIPFVFWSVAGLLFVLCTEGTTSRSIFDLPLQLITGYPVAGHLYYIILLIVFSGMIFLVEKYLRDWQKFAVYMFVIVFSYVGQYSGLNWRMFGWIDHIARYTPARLMEYAPIAVLGMLFAHYYSGKTGNKRNRLIWFTLLLLLAVVLWFLKIPPQPKGFGAQGLAPSFIVVSLCPVAIIIGDMVNDFFSVIQSSLLYLISLTGGGVFYACNCRFDFTRLSWAGRMSLVGVDNICCMSRLDWVFKNG